MSISDTGDSRSGGKSGLERAEVSASRENEVVGYLGDESQGQTKKGAEDVLFQNRGRKVSPRRNGVPGLIYSLGITSEGEGLYRGKEGEQLGEMRLRG